MVKRAGEIRLPFDHDEQAFARAVEQLGVGGSFRVLRKSLDARDKRRIAWVYVIGAPEAGDDSPPSYPPRVEPDPLPVIVGSGPAGLFSAYWLALHGVRSLVLEQGQPIRQRLRSMARFLREGALDPRSNICFGAGGAGTYSDGKLVTRIRSPYIPFVMESFVRFGAPEEVRQLQTPHLGSNRIRRVIQTMIEHLESRGVELRTGCQVASLDIRAGSVEAVELDSGEVIPADRVLLAVGHSARPLYRELCRLGLPMELKPFAVGVRLEHPAALIDGIQYGPAAGHPSLPPARYHLAHTWPEAEGKRALYTFCMCPGGFILNATTEGDGVVTNGMSNAGRRGRFSNAGLVVNVEQRDIPGHNPLRGLEWQRELERAAAAAVNGPTGCHALPGQLLVDFLEGRPSGGLPAVSALVPVRPAPLHDLLPGFVVEAMRQGLVVLGRRIRGLVGPEAVLVGVETRTSSPVRILRDPETRESSIAGLYPVGEGAGYSGGIVSAAVDGIASAQALLERLPRA